MEQREILRRQQVLQQLNAQLQASSKAGLDVRGSKIVLQHPKGTPPKPSRIPRPDSLASKPLPPPGYASEGILLSPFTSTHSPLHPQDRGPPRLNPWQRDGSASHVVTAHTYTSTQLERERERERKRKRPIVKTESQMLGSQNSCLPTPKSQWKPKTGPVVKTDSQVLNAKVSKQLPGPRGDVTRKSRDQRRTQKGDEKRRQPKSKKQEESGNTYDWDKGGRLNELRTRYVARKYFKLWGHRVFGRVLPSAVREHCERTLKRRMFALWYEEWWAARREWKLNIRADCHNRYRLWQLVWRAWTEYMQLVKEKRRKNDAARKLVSLKLKRVTWRQWCEYVKTRREKKAVKRGADKWANAMVVRSAWVRWVKVLETKGQLQVMDTVALHHWAFKLQKHGWCCWVAHHSARLVMRQKAHVASRHHNHGLFKACWRAWVMYVNLRRRKTQMKTVALEFCSSNAMVKCFNVWKYRFLRSRQIAEFQELVSSKGRQARMRRALMAWTHYIELKHYHSYQAVVASNHCILTSKAKGFHALRHYCTQQQRQVANMASAQQFHIQKCLQQVWSQWLRRCEHCEEIKMLPQTRRARTHYNSLLLKRVVGAWRRYSLEQRQRKAQYIIADDHFRTKALPRYFAAMMEFVAIQHYKQDLQERACTFRRETQLAMVFYHWWRSCQLSQDVRMLERVAILHSEELAKRKALKLWQVCTREKIRRSSREQDALFHCERRLMHCAFTKWRLRWQAAIHGAKQRRSAVQHYSHKLLRMIWDAWTRYIDKKRLTHQRCQFAVEHYHKTLAAKTMQTWKAFHAHEQEKIAKKQKAKQLYNYSLRRQVLAQWKANVQFLKWEQSVNEAADDHFGLATVRKYFTVWRERTALSIEAAERENERVREAREQLNRAKLARVLASWREYSSRSVVERLCMERAEKHRNTVVLRKCFTVWHDHYRLALRKMLLQRQCTWFQNTRLLSTCYSQWRVECMKAVQMKQKSALALWHWSTSLQRKALAAWLLYTLNRRRKAERYAQAMERHRRQLVTLGVTQWIKVASATKAQRAENALQQQAKSAQSVLQCVRRCALHWRKVAREHKGTRETLKKTETFPVAREEGGRIQITGGAGVLACKEAGDLWNNLARKLQIPDGPPLSRPQPRMPDFMKTTSSVTQRPYHESLEPHAGKTYAKMLHPIARSTQNTVPHSEAVPRLSVPQPPSPPILYHHNSGRAATAADVSFTFLPSTCSEESIQHWETTSSKPDNTCTSPPKPDLPWETSTQPTSGAATKQCHLVSPTQISGPQNLLSTHSLLPPSAFEIPRCVATRPTASTGPKMDRKPYRSSEPQTIAERSPTESVIPASGLDLSNPAVQMEVVHMRDELRRFHDLKARQRSLEQQISQAAGEGNDEQVSELQRELVRTVGDIQSKEPRIRGLASRISQVLTQYS